MLYFIITISLQFNLVAFLFFSESLKISKRTVYNRYYYQIHILLLLLFSGKPEYFCIFLFSFILSL